MAEARDFMLFSVLGRPRLQQEDTVEIFRNKYLKSGEFNFNSFLLRMSLF